MGDHELNSISPDQMLRDSPSRDSSEQVNRRRHSRVFILAGFVTVLGVCCLVAGVVLITLSQTQTCATKSNDTTATLDQKDTCNGNASSIKNNTKVENPCAFSSEAELAGKPTKCNFGYR